MSKIAAYGSTFTWDGASVVGLSDISFSGLSADWIDLSNHLSTSAYKEGAVGMLDGGEVSIEGYYDYSDTTGQQAMSADFLARTAKTFTVAFPTASGTTLTGSAYLTALKFGDAPVDGAVGFSATIKITGVPTFAFAASTGLTTPFFAISESAVVTPAAANDVYDYVATVLTGVSSVTVTPTATAGVITVNGNTVATGEASSAITLGAAGSNTTITIVVTETAKSPVTYTIRVARAAS